VSGPKRFLFLEDYQVTQADCNARHLRISTCRHALVATVRRRPGKAAVRQMPAVQGREAQVRSFVEAYRKRHGRDPRFSEVRNSLRLPPSTASVYLRRALA
jgi:hypothetical protein